MGKRTLELDKSKIVDSNGNPIIVSGTVNYSVVEPEKYMINIETDQKHYVKNQAEIVLKKIASQYPYESNTGDSLTKEGEQISRRMKEELQKKLNVTGVKVEDFYLTDINYSSDISQQMLIKQRAQAYIEAKETIGNASVEIIKDIINGVEKECNIKLSPDRKERMIGDLLVVITSETGVQPVLNIQQD
jgi:regulator of protease activity HflC (stomatin/prohibitin superfamily)